MCGLNMMLSRLLLPFFLFLLIAMTTEGQNLPLVGAPCNPNNTRLLVENNQLRSDCGYVAWCDASDNICKIRGCRRDEWPFGFNKVSRHLWPPRCPTGQFCPDEESGCLQQVGLGDPCQLSRDDECLQSASPQGVRCLHNKCVAIDATLGKNCAYENTIYTDYITSLSDYGEIISRDNCVSGLYCDSPTTQCKSRSTKGSNCSADKECLSDYCADKSYIYSVPVNNNMTGTCGEKIGADPSKPYVYVLILIFTIAIVVVTFVFLIKIHQKQTKRKKAEREEYWQGQRMIHEKSRLIDGSIRAGTPTLSSSSRLLNQGGGEPGLMAAREFYESARISSSSSASATTTSAPLRRNESKLQSLLRYSDGSSAGQSAAFSGRRDSLPVHPLQQSTSYLDQQQEQRRDSTPNAAVLAPSPSFHSLSEDAYMPAGGVGSSAVDPLTSASHHGDNIETTIRNRDRSHRIGDGWQSPDSKVREPVERTERAIPKTGLPF